MIEGKICVFQMGTGFQNLSLKKPADSLVAFRVKGFRLGIQTTIRSPFHSKFYFLLKFCLVSDEFCGSRCFCT